MSNDELGTENAPEESQQEEATSVDPEEMDYDTLVQKYKETEAQKRHWRKKAKEAQEEPQPLKKEEAKPSQDDDSSWKRRIEFVTTKGRDLDPEEVQAVIDLSRGKNISLEDAAEDPMFKAFQKERKSQKRIEGATPSAAKHSVMVNGKNFHTMSRQDKEANFQEFLRQRLGK